MIDFYKHVIPDKTHEKLTNSIVMMISTGDCPYYGEFSLYLNFHESKSIFIQTAGVNITSKGMNFYWNKNFFDKLSQSETNFILIHEIMHLLFDHTKRSCGYNKESANIVQDMIINQIIYDEIMISQGLGIGNNPIITIPKDDNNNNNMGLFIPKDYHGLEIFEELYEWYSNKKQNWEKTFKGKQGDGKQGDGKQGDGKQGDGKQGDGKGNKTNYGKNGKNGVECYSLESIFENQLKDKQCTLDTHLLDNVPDELKKQIVEDIKNSLKNRGLSNGSMDLILNRLIKKKKDYLKEIKRNVTNHIFGNKKNKTIVRPNRRNIGGLKGSKKYKTEINVILDTSGSMCDEFEKTLSYIFQNDITINLIQCDTTIQDTLKIKNKKELEKMVISGLGGTVIQPAIDYISDQKNKIYSNNTCILTDGYTDRLNFKNIKTKVLILSTKSNCPIEYDNGKIKQIINIGKDD